MECFIHSITLLFSLFLEKLLHLIELFISDKFTLEVSEVTVRSAALVAVAVVAAGTRTPSSRLERAGSS